MEEKKNINPQIKGLEVGSHFTWDFKNYRWWNFREVINAILTSRRVWCWGADFKRGQIGSFRDNEKQEVDYFRFKVNANRHQSWVYIALHGSDTFHVWLTDDNLLILKKWENIYIDELIQVIDDEIERIPEYQD